MHYSKRTVQSAGIFLRIREVKSSNGTLYNCVRDVDVQNFVAIIEQLRTGKQDQTFYDLMCFQDEMHRTPFALAVAKLREHTTGIQFSKDPTQPQKLLDIVTQLASLQNTLQLNEQSIFNTHGFNVIAHMLNTDSSTDQALNAPTTQLHPTNSNQTANTTPVGQNSVATVQQYKAHPAETTRPTTHNSKTSVQEPHDVSMLAHKMNSMDSISEDSIDMEECDSILMFHPTHFERYRMLLYAMENQMDNVVSILIDHCPYIFPQCFEYTFNNGNTFLSFFIHPNRAEMLEKVLRLADTMQVETYLANNAINLWEQAIETHSYSALQVIMYALIQHHLNDALNTLLMTKDNYVTIALLTTDSDRNTVLHYAIQSNNMPALQLLLDYHSDNNTTGIVAIDANGESNRFFLSYGGDAKNIMEAPESHEDDTEQGLTIEPFHCPNMIDYLVDENVAIQTISAIMNKLGIDGNKAKELLNCQDCSKSDAHYQLLCLNEVLNTSEQLVEDSNAENVLTAVQDAQYAYSFTGATLANALNAAHEDALLLATSYGNTEAVNILLQLHITLYQQDMQKSCTTYNSVDSPKSIVKEILALDIKTADYSINDTCDQYEYHGITISYSSNNTKQIITQPITGLLRHSKRVQETALGKAIDTENKEIIDLLSPHMSINVHHLMTLLIKYPKQIITVAAKQQFHTFKTMWKLLQGNPAIARGSELSTAASSATFLISYCASQHVLTDITQHNPMRIHIARHCPNTGPKIDIQDLLILLANPEQQLTEMLNSAKQYPGTIVLLTNMVICNGNTPLHTLPALELQKLFAYMQAHSHSQLSHGGIGNTDINFNIVNAENETPLMKAILQRDQYNGRMVLWLAFMGAQYNKHPLMLNNSNYPVQAILFADYIEEIRHINVQNEEVRELFNALNDPTQEVYDAQINALQCEADQIIQSYITTTQFTRANATQNVQSPCITHQLIELYYINIHNGGQAQIAAQALQNWLKRAPKAIFERDQNNNDPLRLAISLQQKSGHNITETGALMAVIKALQLNEWCDIYHYITEDDNNSLYPIIELANNCTDPAALFLYKEIIFLFIDAAINTNAVPAIERIFTATEGTTTLAMSTVKSVGSVFTEEDSNQFMNIVTNLSACKPDTYSAVLEHTDENGNNILHIAASAKSWDLVLQLLQFQRLITQEDNNNLNAAHHIMLHASNQNALPYPCAMSCPGMKLELTTYITTHLIPLIHKMREYNSQILITSNAQDISPLIYALQRAYSYELLHIYIQDSLTFQGPEPTAIMEHLQGYRGADQSTIIHMVARHSVMSTRYLEKMALNRANTTSTHSDNNDLDQNETRDSNIGNKEELDLNITRHRTILNMMQYDMNAQHNLRINAQNRTGLTALHIVVKYPCLQTTQMLLAINGIDPTVRDYNLNTSLHCINGDDAKHIQITKLLIETLPNAPFRLNSENLNPMMLFAMKGYTNALQVILNNNPTLTNTHINQRDNNGNTALHLAVQNNHVEACKVLLRVANINVNATNNDNMTPICIAIEQTNEAMVDAIIASPKCNPEAHEFTKKPIFLAIKHDVPFLETILKWGDTHINEFNSYAITPIYYAVKRYQDRPIAESLSNIRTLLEHRNKHGQLCVDVNKECDVVHLTTPLLQSMRNSLLDNGHFVGVSPTSALEATKLLLEYKGKDCSNPIDVSTTNFNKLNALHIAIIENAPIEQIRLLISNGVDINATDQFGYTPLHYAVVIAHKAVVKELLLYPQIQINAQNHHGNTPLFLAVMLAEELDIMPDTLHRFPLPVPKTKTNGCDAIEALERIAAHSKCNFNMQNNEGLTVLHIASGLAVSHGLFDKFTAVNARDKNGNTPLLTAIINGNYAIAILLLEYCNPNADKTTPNAPAKRKNFIPKPDVNITLCNKMGQTPMQAMQVALYTHSLHISRNNQHFTPHIVTTVRFLLNIAGVATTSESMTELNALMIKHLRNKTLNFYTIILSLVLSVAITVLTTVVIAVHIINLSNLVKDTRTKNLATIITLSITLIICLILLLSAFKVTQHRANSRLKPENTTLMTNAHNELQTHNDLTTDESDQNIEDIEDDTLADNTVLTTALPLHNQQIVSVSSDNSTMAESETSSISSTRTLIQHDNSTDALSVRQNGGVNTGAMLSMGQDDDSTETLSNDSDTDTLPHTSLRDVKPYTGSLKLFKASFKQTQCYA